MEEVAGSIPVSSTNCNEKYRFDAIVLNLFFCWHKGIFALSAKLEVSLVEVPLGAFAGLFYFLNVTMERKGLNKISCLE